MKGAPSLIALLGKPKSDESEEEPTDEAAGGGGTEREFAREAFGALQDNDEEGFISAFLGAVKACVRKGGAGGYEDEDAGF